MIYVLIFQYIYAINGGISMADRSIMAAFFAEMRIMTSPLPDNITKVSQFPDLGLRKMLYGEDAPFLELLPSGDDTKDIINICLVQDQYNCRYIITNKYKGKNGWIVGPYILEDMMLTDITRLYHKLGMQNADMNMLRQYYLSIPRIRDESMFDALINANCVSKYGAQKFEIGFWKLESSASNKFIENKSHYTDHVIKSMENRYKLEHQMMDCIIQGNYYGAEKVISKLNMYGRGTRASNTLRDGKNYAIILNTICRIAAERGGATPLAVDRCSNLYALEIEASGSIAQIRSFRDKMLRDYCQIVRDSVKEDYSPLVRQAIDIISGNISEKASLSLVAKQLNISQNYLSAIFKKETGSSFTNYIIDKRLSYAKVMLGTTNLPVSEIAASCGINDQNYFARLFKAKENMTPLQYRTKVQNKKIG